MMQKDVILRFPKLCSREEVDICNDFTSNMDELKMELSKDEHGADIEVAVKTGRKICELCVPASCHRIRCNEGMCKMSGLIESQQNESGFWVRLPCSSCKETCNLSEITKGFVFNG